MNLIKKLAPIVKNAGKILLEAHSCKIESNVIEKSGDVNFVTQFDIQTQEFLISSILKVIPNACFMAEEQENDPSVLQREYCFVIDPIDGTTNFIHNYKRSSISVAMFSFGVPVLGIIYDPYLDEMFWAEKGKGAYVNGERMIVSDRDISKAVVSYGTSPYYKDELAYKTFDLCKEIIMVAADLRRTGSAAIDLANLAAGRTDAFFELRLSPWDIAAGYVLITEAGGKITDLYGNEIDFTRPSPVFASNTIVYDKLLSITSKY